MSFKNTFGGFVVASAFALASGVAFAQSTNGSDEENSIWRESHPVYEFKHPLKVNCREFLDTEAVYRPFVIAWLSGRMVGVLDIGDPDAFVPVSVPQIVELCSEEPDEMVWELVRVQ